MTGDLRRLTAIIFIIVSCTFLACLLFFGCLLLFGCLRRFLENFESLSCVFSQI